MSALEQLKKPKYDAAVLTILGDAGMGKTRLAASLPSPVFIMAEDGLASIPEADRPLGWKLTSSDQLWSILKDILKEEHPYKTVVIDSVSALDDLFTKEILVKEGKPSLAQCAGGYGAGYKVLAGMHARVGVAAEALKVKGINVCYIAHANVDRMELPDIEAYNRYVLKISKDCQAPYVDKPDMVGFIRLQTFLRGDEGQRKQAISSDVRELIAFATASNVSKNRFDIKAPIVVEMGVNPFEGIIPALSEGKKA